LHTEEKYYTDTHKYSAKKHAKMPLAKAKGIFFNTEQSIPS